MAATPNDILNPDTTMGAVTLRVGDLQGMSDYYSRAFAMEPLEERADRREVHRAAQEPRSRFVGSSDHSVSEAFYFTDPEGNGVEPYTDRDRSQWIHDDGEIRISTESSTPMPTSSLTSTRSWWRPVRAVRERSDTCTCRSATSRPPAPSTWMLSDSRPPRPATRVRSSHPPAATTTTWR